MKNYAILIGSSRFEKEPKLTPLRCPENDVDGMRDMLTSAEFGLFAADDLLIFKNRNHYEILPEINDVFSQAEPQDLILLYYSGHGELDKKDRLHLATLDTQKRIIETTSIPTERLRRLIDNHRCKRVVLILDCCFSGSVEKDFLNRSTANSEIERLSKGIYILTASTASQPAEEKEGDEYGLLTRHILEGIKTGQAVTNQDGLISVDAIYHYVSRQVPKSGAQDPMRYDLQVQGDSLFIARVVKAYSETQLRVFKKKINELDNEDALPGDLIKQTREIISGNQQKRDKAFFDLLYRLCERNLGLWPFQQLWMAQIGQASLLSTPATSEPQPSPPPQKTKPTLKVEAKPDRIVAPKSFTETINGVPLEMILVPVGRFKMGSTKAQVKQAWENAKQEYKDAKLEWFSREMPPHDVTIPQFYIGKFQITQAQWKAVMGEKLQLHFKGNDLPMESISWEDAQVFCQKISVLTSKEYRLPSEAEWEYACRAGTTGDYAGNLDEMAWRGKNSDSKTHPVGQKKSNAFGLYDMHGNVWEWCEDVWHENYDGAPNNGSVWSNGGNSEYRVLRGGSWYGSGYVCRAAYRLRNAPGARSNYLGFRVVAAARTS